MSYLAIARKWRPQKFEDLVGQEHVVQTLKNAISLNRVSHAYLFSGARGVGKTSVARIFAKALRCPNVQDGVPCNQCAECTAIAESRSVDVAEIDGASHNGVEAVRSIRDNVVYAPSTGSYKIYIIDEAHMLSIAAFNALLKTLEEPPAHVVFMMATTEAQKIPVTILSRCQRFEFRRLKQTEIVSRLTEILAEESIQVSEEGLRTIAAHSDGSLRDALSLLDQVLSYQAGTSGELTNSQVVSALGISDSNAATDFLEFIARKDISSALDKIEALYAAGIDFKQFAERCLMDLRSIYLLSVGAEEGSLPTAERLDISSQEWERLKGISGTLKRVQIERMAQILSKTVTQMTWNPTPRFLLEMACVRMAHLDALDALEKAVTQGAPIAYAPPSAPVMAQQANPTPTQSTQPPMQMPVRTAPPQPTGQSQSPAQNQARTSTEPPPPSEPPASFRQPPPPQSYAAPPPNQRNWQGFVDTVMKKRPLLGALLCHADFSQDGQKLTLSFAQDSFYEQQAKDSRSEMDSFIKSYFGNQIQWHLQAKGADQIQSIEAARLHEAEKIRQDALGHPSVAKVKEILGAEVVDVNVEV